MWHEQILLKIQTQPFQTQGKSPVHCVKEDPPRPEAVKAMSGPVISFS